MALADSADRKQSAIEPVDEYGTMMCEECGDECEWTPLGLCGHCQGIEDMEAVGL